MSDFPGALGRCRRLALCCAWLMHRPSPPKPTEPTPGLYVHYKGNRYRVQGLAMHSETQEWLVVYEALYGSGGLFVRPAAMFVETVEVNGQRVPRFARVGD